VFPYAGTFTPPVHAHVRRTQTVERTGARRFAQRQIQRQGLLAPVADLCVSCDMKSHSPLLSVGNLTKSCLSRQVFQGSRRWTGGGNATVQGLKPS